MLIVPPPPFRRAGSGGGGGGWTGPTAFASGASQSSDAAPLESSSIFLAVPSDSVGKYALAFVSGWVPGAANGMTVSTPSGWTLISSGASFGNYSGESGGYYSVRTHVFGKRLNGSDTFFCNISYSGTQGGHASGFMRSYDNVHATTPYERVSLEQDATVFESSNIEVGDRLLDGPRRLAIIAVGMSGQLSTQPPSGWTTVSGLPSDSYIYVDERNYTSGPIPTQNKPVGTGIREGQGLVKIELSLVPAV